MEEGGGVWLDRFGGCQEVFLVMETFSREVRRDEWLLACQCPASREHVPLDVV